MMNSNPSVFKGEVTERVTERPREISQMKKNGLASPASTWRGRSLGIKGESSNPRPPARISEQEPNMPQQRFPAIDSTNENAVPQIDNDAAMKQIMQMSPEELQEAQREVAAMFKPKNLEYLKKLALKNRGSTAESDVDVRRVLHAEDIGRSKADLVESSAKVIDI